MAARQQPKGTGFGVQYEDLVPKFKWKDQPEATLLTIYLPGFTKEQVNVTYVHSSKMIRVTGESPLANRRWSRFIETFTVPQNCIVDKIHGSFNNNAVTITMPKESIKKMLREEAISKERAETRKLQEEAISKEMAEARKLQEEAISKEMDMARKLQKEAISKEMAETRKLLEEAIRKEMAETRKLLEETIAKEKAEARKPQEETIAKEKAEARKLQEEAIAKEEAEARKFQEEAKEKKKLVEEAALEKKIEEKKSVDESVGKESILMPEERKFSVLYKIWSRFSDQTCVGRSKRYREINEENMERDNGENKRKRVDK